MPSGPDGLSVDEAVDVLFAEPVVCLIAEAGGELVGAAFAVVVGALGVVGRVAVAEDAPGAVEPLLDRLEASLAERGARKLVSWSQPGAATPERLADRGYEQVEGALLLQRSLPPTIAGPGALERLGGRMVDPQLWDSLRGVEHAKSIIERRVILPLERPDLARRHGVAQPKAIVLFGPPGTGKTTFAKGIAARLQWPFVEIQPSELADGEPEREARFLAEAFDLVADLASAVVFVDEVEDLASVRHDDRRVGPSVTNEFLRQIPRLREAPYHLLVCATNWVGRLDPAFLRPGRFDYILPVGPPDSDARAAIWDRYIGEISDEDVDVGALVEASRWFTPADIEFAARKAAQMAFEREHFEGADRRATTDEFLAAIRETRPTLSEGMIEQFQRDVEEFARY